MRLLHSSALSLIHSMMLSISWRWFLLWLPVRCSPKFKWLPMNPAWMRH